MEFGHSTPFEDDSRRPIHPIRHFFNLHPNLLQLLASAESTGKSAESILDHYIRTLEESQLHTRNSEGDSDPTKLDEQSGGVSATGKAQNDFCDSSTFINGRINSLRTVEDVTGSQAGSFAQSGSDSMDSENCNQISQEGTTIATVHEPHGGSSNRQGMTVRDSSGSKRELPLYPTDDDLEFCTTLLVENISPSLDLEELANIFNYYVEIIPLSMTIHPPIHTHKTAILWLEFANPVETRAAWVILDGYRTHGRGMIPKLRYRPPEVDLD